MKLFINANQIRLSNFQLRKKSIHTTKIQHIKTTDEFFCCQTKVRHGTVRRHRSPYKKRELCWTKQCSAHNSSSKHTLQHILFIVSFRPAYTLLFMLLFCPFLSTLHTFNLVRRLSARAFCGIFQNVVPICVFFFLLNQQHYAQYFNIVIFQQFSLYFLIHKIFIYELFYIIYIILQKF